MTFKKFHKFITLSIVDNNFITMNAIFVIKISNRKSTHSIRSHFCMFRKILIFPAVLSIF